MDDKTIVEFSGLVGKVFTSVVKSTHGAEDAMVFTVSDDESYMLYYEPD